MSETSYIWAKRGITSWLVTLDHKRIGIMYAILAMGFFFIGGMFALVMRLELMTPGETIMTAEEFGDFNLRFDYQVSPGGNSGIYVRVPADGNHHRSKEDQPAAGFEVQVLDDSALKYAKLKDYQYCGSVYDITGATSHVGKPPGQWNTLEINCKGQHITTVQP